MTFFMSRRQQVNLLTAIILKGLVALGTLTGIAACGPITPPPMPVEQPIGAPVVVLDGTLVLANSAS